MANEKRTYTKKARALAEEETRRRITESTVELHGTVGPARTTISAVAERAGVRRATVYRHFPDEAALFAACSGHWVAANPPPDPTTWAAIDDPDRRLKTALGELYPYYRRNERMMSNLMRDSEAVPIVGELLDSGLLAYVSAVTEILSRGRRGRGRGKERVSTAIRHAVGFSAWRSLAVEQGLTDDEAIDLMCRFVVAAA